MEIGQALITFIMSLLGSGVSTTVVSYVLNARKERKETDKETYIGIKKLVDNILLSYLDSPDYYNGVPCFVHENLKNFRYLAVHTNRFCFHDKKIKLRFDHVVCKLCAFMENADAKTTPERFDAEKKCFTHITTVPDADRGNYEKKKIFLDEADEINDLALVFRSEFSDFEAFVINRLRISPSKIN